MELSLAFTCRECGKGAEVQFDTAYLQQAVYLEETLGDEPPVRLRCDGCGHVSGEIHMQYRFKPEHRPIQDRARQSGVTLVRFPGNAGNFGCVRPAGGV